MLQPLVLFTCKVLQFFSDFLYFYAFEETLVSCKYNIFCISRDDAEEKHFLFDLLKKKLRITLIMTLIAFSITPSLSSELLVSKIVL